MKLVRGKGAPGKGACYMSAIQHYITLGKGLWHDHPDCVDPAIRSLGIWINDNLGSDEARERVIGPHLFTPVGTSQGLALMDACKDSIFRSQRALTKIGKLPCA